MARSRRTMTNRGRWGLSMIRQNTRIAALALMMCGATQVASAQSFTPPGDGKPLFDGLCQDCHGVNGTGDEGPALNHPLGADDAALHKIIRDGIPERGMPRVRRMTEEEADVLVSYVRTLGRGGPIKVAGDADKSRAGYHRLRFRNRLLDRRPGGGVPS